MPRGESLAQDEEEKVPELPKRVRFQTRLEEFGISSDSAEAKQEQYNRDLDSPDQIDSSSAERPITDPQLRKLFELPEDEQD